MFINNLHDILSVESITVTNTVINLGNTNFKFIWAYPSLVQKRHKYDCIVYVMSSDPDHWSFVCKWKYW